MTKKTLKIVSAASVTEQEDTRPEWLRRGETKPWVPGANVMQTWKAHGFVPPSEYRNDYNFKTNREIALQGD